MDFSWAISNALSRVQPDLIILAELELWPNWIRLSTRRKIPIAVINGRLSQRSLNGYQRFRKIIRSIVSQITWIGAQSITYRDRFIELGVPSNQVEVTGNIKFDGANYDRLHPEVVRRSRELGLPPEETHSSSHQPKDNALVWLCGSTQSPEEQLCLDAFMKLADRFPSLKLILVPRHPERFEEVARLIQQTGLPSLRRSLMQDGQVTSHWRIFLADSVGELRWWWGLADVGFVGGSFGSRGGQNMIEPCAVRVATCFGPNTKNFADVVQILLEANGAVALSEPQQLLEWITAVIENNAMRDDLAYQGQQVAMSHRGATERTWKRLVQLLSIPASN
jgi:3-deoxy-D-manno-octulosonic-acid transferase